MLGKVPVNQREELALEYAREAILPVEGVEVTSVKCRQADFEKLVLEMTLEYNGEDAPKEQAMFLWQLNFLKGGEERDRLCKLFGADAAKL